MVMGLGMGAGHVVCGEWCCLGGTTEVGEARKGSSLEGRMYIDLHLVFVCLFWLPPPHHHAARQETP